MLPEIHIPLDAIQVQRGQDCCPGSETHTTPDVIDYQRRTAENPDCWRKMALFALFQCKSCGCLYYLHEVESTGS